MSKELLNGFLGGLKQKSLDARKSEAIEAILNYCKATKKEFPDCLETISEEEYKNRHDGRCAYIENASAPSNFQRFVFKDSAEITGEDLAIIERELSIYYDQPVHQQDKDIAQIQKDAHTIKNIMVFFTVLYIVGVIATLIIMLSD